MRFIALFLPVGLMGCPGTGPEDGQQTYNDDSGTSTVDLVTFDVTVDWAIDGVIQDDPVPVCLHDTEGETGSEAVLATAVTTGSAIQVTVPKTGQQARAWIGPATASLTADGHRILEYNGRHYIHPITDFLVEEDCEEVVEVNEMPVLEGVEYDCETTQYWTGDDEPFNQQSGVHTFLAQEGKYFTDPSESGIGGAIGTNEKLMTEGSRLKVYSSTNGTVETEDDTVIDENGFTLRLVRNGVDTILDCSR